MDLLVAVFGHMSLGSFGSMLMGVHVMAVGGMGVMRRLLVISRIVMFRGGVVMFGGVLVMFRSLAVVLSSFLGHDEFSPGFQSIAHLTIVRFTSQNAQVL